ncbi:excinuclease ABC subunit UvrA [Patescibacteria group bacterium]|nr:excinuclease ABC subunit UvrA [Patescibacteria group bacterium]MBU1674001.1 excinuclease ABC subunit UvrA [Patescibacteria group bacterium]MBU1962926.1 excinuclease ABC subunit UvrA [Patescibacteria group bacterium]
MDINKISVKGARVHNLKNINVDIPRDKLVVITGISGSGKSSLAFDTIYAEGQRRYVESLSAYARQFLGLMDKPDVDQIEGLSPAISIDQKTASHNPRSTVGTVTEVYDYLRLLYARIGIPHCPKCGQVIVKQTRKQISDKILKMEEGTEFMIISPIIRDKKGEHKSVIEEARKSGYVRLRIDNNLYSIEEAEDKDLDKKKKHNIDVVIDRLTIGKELEKERLTESLETALDLSNGLVVVHDSKAEKDNIFSEHFSCPKCDISLEDIEPRNFSFNSPHGACPECTGLGTKLEVDENLVIPNKKLSIAEGAIRPWSRTSSNQTWQMRILEAVAKTNGFSTRTPIKNLSPQDLNVILFGTGSKSYDVNAPYTTGKVKEFYTNYEGVIPNLERRHRETESDYMRTEIERYMRIYACPLCVGKRLRKEALGVTIADQNISQVTSLPIDKTLDFFRGLKLNQRDQKIAKQILKEIDSRLKFLTNVGLSYLTLDRTASTLAGGEAQRIRLATQIGSALTGVLYILDEPSIGLHQRDNMRLIETLQNLKALGNTVIVVEHDEETILEADYVIDIGPGAGAQGGEVVAQGTPAELMKKKCLTGEYLSGKKEIAVPKKFRKGNGLDIEVIGAAAHNLKEIDVKIPLGKLVSITGVSGSGKSTLMTDILARALALQFHNAKNLPAEHKEIKGLKNLDKVIHIDQSPIGRTPRSNPATYTGVFTYIRDLFTQVPESKMRGYKAGRFSFNVKGGRCEACQGDGVQRIEMHFLPDVYVKCPECKGKRYNPEALEIHYREKNISDVLEMSVEEAYHFFGNIPAVKEKMQTLRDVGLGYIKLGQNATTLSGGEAQRVKLATELSRRATGKTLYILDEPTTGLHFEDVKKLLSVLNRLVDKGNSVLIIEHNLDVIKSCDWIIDLGPEGGDRGGLVIAQGTPPEVAKEKKSYTGKYLRRYFK